VNSYDVAEAERSFENSPTKCGFSKTTRISIRRKSMFQDYIEARKKKWFNSRQTFKVTLLENQLLMMEGHCMNFTGLLRD